MGEAAVSPFSVSNTASEGSRMIRTQWEKGSGDRTTPPHTGPQHPRNSRAALPPARATAAPRKGFCRWQEDYFA